MKFKGLIFALLLSSGAMAQDIDDCVIDFMKESSEIKNYEQWVDDCNTDSSGGGLISTRLIAESSKDEDYYSITAHKRNYFLPIYSTSAINKEAYSFIDDKKNGFTDNLEDLEAKIQLSFKIPLNEAPLMVKNDRLYFAFTMRSFWQIHSTGLSKPFRETNYQPEMFYYMPTELKPFGGSTSFGIGIEHQSNGQTEELSRSWNKVNFNLLYEKDNFILCFQPWYRLPEEEKKGSDDDKGDDNPDIEKYLGQHEIKVGYLYKEHEISVTSRRNFRSGYGHIEIEYTFPLWGKIHGYTSLSHGYGDSLIDYNHEQTRFGLGFAFNKMF